MNIFNAGSTSISQLQCNRAVGFKPPAVLCKDWTVKSATLTADNGNLSEMLYEDFDIEDEKTNEKSTMLLCGIGTDNRKLDRLQHVLSKL